MQRLLPYTFETGGRIHMATKTLENMTLGKMIAERRSVLGLSLKDLGRLVHKDDGHGVSAQYLHDMERDRRTPSPHVLGELARALGIDPYYLAAVAGQTAPEITTYLRERPDTAPAVAALFARARATGFTDWDNLNLFKKAAG